MTEQQIVQEFKSYPKTKKSVVIRQLLRIFEEDLEEIAPTNAADESAIEQRRRAVDRLRGIAAVAGKTPPIDEQVKEDYRNYISEKYK